MGDPKRDPRKHVVSIIYRIDIEPDSVIKAGDDASKAQFFPMEKIIKNQSLFAFDHYDVLNGYIKKVFPNLYD